MDESEETGIIDASATHATDFGRPSAVDDVDRRAIRRERRDAAKAARRVVRQRYDDVLDSRPAGSQPANQILGKAVDCYRDGPIPRAGLKKAIAELEAAIRRELPDLMVTRSPRTVSAKPERVGIMIYETRAFTEGSERFITAENHSVVLEEHGPIFISGLQPGGTRPHLFERILERSGPPRPMAEIQLRLTSVWPTLLWMRAEQRMQGRGSPITVMITPFDDGLLFGSLEKVEGMPPAGPTVVTYDWSGQRTRQLRDSYGSPNGDRLWAMTRTFVDATLLAPDQIALRDMLSDFIGSFADVVASNDWRWRIGLGERDPAVAIVAGLFRIAIPTDARQADALAALERIIASDAWRSVAAATVESQQRRQLGAALRS